MSSHFSDDEKWMRLAIEQAKLAALEEKFQLGQSSSRMGNAWLLVIICQLRGTIRLLMLK